MQIHPTFIPRPQVRREDGYRPVISHLNLIKRPYCPKPARGCRNQLVSAWEALFTVSVCWHMITLGIFYSISADSPHACTRNELLFDLFLTLPLLVIVKNVPLAHRNGAGI